MKPVPRGVLNEISIAWAAGAQLISKAQHVPARLQSLMLRSESAKPQLNPNNVFCISIAIMRSRVQVAGARQENRTGMHAYAIYDRAHSSQKSDSPSRVQARTLDTCIDDTVCAAMSA